MIELVLNGACKDAATLPPEYRRDFGAGAERAPLNYLALCPQYRPTPLHTLPALAASLGLAAVHIKDESARLRLNSFKSLGGAYAVFRIVHAQIERQLAQEFPLASLLSPPARQIASAMTFVCATDGNHGRSIAAGARLLGALAVILVHEGVSEPRIQVIRDLGATILRVPGDYDDSVAEARKVASEKGWSLVADTSWPGYEAVPRQVMQGYVVSAAEAWQQLTALAVQPTHILLQAGVGGFAAAIAVHAHTHWVGSPPRILIIEPDRSACLLASMRVGRPIKIDHRDATVMAMLECFEPSSIAFEILQALATAFVAIDDAYAVNAVRRLAQPLGADPPIRSGESGAAGLGGLLALREDPTAFATLGLGPAARVLLFNTEGATDSLNRSPSR